MARGEAESTVVVASAALIKLYDEDPNEPSKMADRIGAGLGWQKVGWEWFDKHGEVWFVGTWRGNAMAQIDWTITYGPQRLPTRDEEGKPNSWVTDVPALEAAEAALDELRGWGGTQTSWSMGLGQCLTIAGECYLLGFPVNRRGEPAEGQIPVESPFPPLNGNRPEMKDNPAVVGESWMAISPTALEKRDSSIPNDVDEQGRPRKRIYAQLTEKGEPQLMPRETIAVRIWRNHPRWPSEPTSAMKALNAECEVMEKMDRALRATVLSKVHNGILKVPAESLQGSIPNGPGGLSSQVHGAGGAGAPSRPELHPVINDLVEGLSTPIKDPGSAAAVVPAVVQIPERYIEKWDWLQIAREIDPEQGKARAEKVRALAQGFDMPADLLTGLSDLNHWNAWVVTEDAFRQHIEPEVRLAEDGITEGYLWPKAVAKLAGLDDFFDDTVEDPGEEMALRDRLRPFRVGHDASRLVSHPNRAKDALDAVRVGAISLAAVRKYLGFKPSDAPTDAELKQMADLGIIGRRIRPSDDTGGGGPEEVDPGPAESRSRRRLAVVRASADSSDLAVFSRRCGDMEASHLRDSLIMANDAITEATRSASSKLRSRAAKVPALRAALKGEPSCKVPSLIGRQRCRDLALEESDKGISGLFLAALAALLASYREITNATLATWAAMVADLTGKPLSPIELARLDLALTAAEAVLERGVTEVAEARLFDPTALMPEEGEIPAGVSIPVAVVRRASAAAGGDQVEGGAAVMGVWAGGLLSGQLASDAMAARSYPTASLVWLYGAASRRGEPFRPHQLLDGGEFSGPDDPALDGLLPWPGKAHPGDHRGCQCVWFRQFSTSAV